MITGGVHSPFMIIFLTNSILFSQEKNGYNIIFSSGFVILLFNFICPHSTQYSVLEGMMPEFRTLNLLFLLITIYMEYIPQLITKYNHKRKSYKKYKAEKNELSVDYSNKIGEGYFGRIYKGKYCDELVAVKQIIPEKKNTTSASETRKSFSYSPDNSNEENHNHNNTPAHNPLNSVRIDKEKENYLKEITILKGLSASPYIVKYLGMKNILVELSSFHSFSDLT
jgi:hypothetical protein